MLCIEDLLTLEIFQSLPPTRLDWICERAQALRLSAGEVLTREGDPPRGFFVLTSGRISITRRSSGVEMPIGQHHAPGFFGEIPVLTDEPSLVTLRALEDCHLYETSAADFLEVLHDCRDFERTMFRAIQQRLRGLEAFIQNREKMAALGTLAAGLAHELNNPAAALVRVLKNIPDALQELQRMNLVYGQRQVDQAHTEQWLKVRDQGYAAILSQTANPMTLGEREERLLTWLEDYRVSDAWKLAEPLSWGGVEPETLERLMDRWRDDPTELREMGIHWLALSFDVMRMVASGQRGAERISELVQSMKSYVHLDQGAQQWVDVHEGIEDTLRLLSYPLTGIEVQRHYSASLPRVLAYGSELNQVWTHLIDNAIDAINAINPSSIDSSIDTDKIDRIDKIDKTDKTETDESRRRIEISTSHCEHYVQVQIADYGCGVPEQLHNRIFEPFFTTKPVGKNSGLGLDVARRIVENRHQGSISLDTYLGKTSFIVCLPLTPQDIPTFLGSEVDSGTA